jgi:hypothetical protein
MPSTTNATDTSHTDAAPAQTLADADEPVVVRGSDDLVATVPHLVGFPPERSLVLVSMHRHGARSRLGLVARFDLPPDDSRSCSMVVTAEADLATQAVEVMLRDEPSEVIALVYADEPCSVEPPWRTLVERLGLAFQAVDVPVLDALHVSQHRFRSYRCKDVGCCPEPGRPVDPTSSAAAAELVARGSAPLSSRSALRGLVQPSDRERCASVEAAARRELTSIGRHWADEGKARWRSWQVESLELLRDTADRILAGGPGLDNDEAGRILAALCDVPVRDAAAMLLTRWARGSDDEGEDRRPHKDGEHRGTRMDQLLEAMRRGADHPPAAQLEPQHREALLTGFWIELSTSCDGPLAVPPLTLLGMHVWSQGNGALASVAVQRALALDPDYRLARLLDDALSLGVRPGPVGPVS